jgi:glycosyltransferase involved in cell wall biosynthesis
LVPGRLTRVLVVLPGLERGGAETYVVRVVPRLLARGIEVEVCALDATGPLAAELHAAGIRVHGTSYPERSTRSNTAVLLRTVRDLRRVLVKGRFDLVHSYLFWPDVLAAAAGRLARRRVIVSRRAIHAWRHPRSALLHGLEAGSNLLADALIANSRAVLRDAEAHERFLPRRRAVVYNGVEPGDYQLARLENSGGLRVVTVGALSPRKGQELAIRALAKLPAAIGATLQLVGTGPDESRLRDLVLELKMEDRVEFLGERTDPRPELASAHLFLLPSRQEGFSNALLEAMASGLPVVATDVGGNAEAVVDGEGGRIVPPENPAEIVAAIEQLASDRAWLKAAGAANRRRVETHFGLDASAAALAEHYLSGR